MMNETHDPQLTSWVQSANAPLAAFPIQNLPFGVFSRTGDSASRVGVAIGDQILDVTACRDAGLLAKSAAARACGESSLNTLMGLDPAELSDFRREVSALLKSDGKAARSKSRAKKILIPMRDAIMGLPAEVGDYTDFYASIHHATNVGSMFRPDNPLLPNYKYVPIGYHGRASSIIASGTDVKRPSGQTKSPDATAPSFGPSKMLDYESELGFFVGRGNEIGATIPIDESESHIFGYCLVNDWSARDIQSWEYQPLGPFLAKNFATTLSPWVVTAEAIEPYRIPLAARAAGDPQPLKYLRSGMGAARGGIAAYLEVFLSTKKMRASGAEPFRLSRASFESMYWSPAQMLTHHASNGCNMKPGDLLASGTVSGDSPESRGCLLELTWRGANPIKLPNREVRRFLEDGDEVIMKGHLEMEGRARIGFGECRGTVVPADQV